MKMIAACLLILLVHLPRWSPPLLAPSNNAVEVGPPITLAQRLPTENLESFAVQTNPQLASPACKACRDNCVGARERCKTSACKSNGGQDQGPAACKDVKNQKGFERALKACEDHETACWNQCAAGACK